MKFYRAKVKCSDFKSMGVCALNQIHAAQIVNERCKEYGYTPQEFNIDSVKQDGSCDWELGTSIIYG